MLCEFLLTVAAAQQPLETFVAGAGSAATDGRLARSAVERARAQRGETLGPWLPRVSGTAGYTRNQVAVEASFPDGQGGLETVTITAKDQLDAIARIDVPLFDLPAWTRWAAAGATLQAARERASAVEQEVTAAVATSWYRLVAARAIVAAARDAESTARSNAAYVERRQEAGLASMLDVERSRADLARAEEAVANAELEVALATRQLEVLTGVAVDETPVDLKVDDREEQPLERWMARVDDTPDVNAASAEARAARSQRAAAGTQLLPSVGAFAAERFTNAAGFGPSALWSAGVEATWTLDVGRTAAVSAANAAVVTARVNEERAREQVATAVHRSWHRIRALRRRVEAARQREEALARGSRVARARFDAGASSQLDVSIAERDRFQAAVDRIRASADLELERRLLRLRAGLPPDAAVEP